MVLGTAVGLNLLLGIPILPAVFFSVFDTLVFQVVLPLMVNSILLNSKLNLCFEKSTTVLSSATSKTEAM
jgi:Mn2+/Fe2+ NRAMP family transporter